MNSMSRPDGMKWTQAPPWNLVVWAFAALGILFRLRQYLFDRSLWLDEAFVALNIINRSPSELLKPLDYHQAAPLGFVALEKAAVIGFGTSEAVLRLVPFLSGILSMILFVIVSRRLLAPAAAIIAVGLFAVSDPLIYYSAEAKQYSSDVAVAIILFWLAGYLLERRVKVGPSIAISIVGAVAIWFSQPAVFVLAAIGVSWLSDSIPRRDRRELALLFIPVALWPASFLLSFLVSLRGLTHDSTLMDYWQGAFAPFPPMSVADVRWFIDSFFGIFSDPGGLTLVGVAAVAAVMGLVEFSSKHFARFLLLLTPLVAALAASALHRYPFRGRLLLFLVPSLILLMAAGLERIRARTSDTLPCLSFLLTGFLFLHPLLVAGSGLIKPRTKEEIKPIITYVENHRQDGDVLYIYYSAIYPFQYYSTRHLIHPMDEITGVESRQNWASYRKDLDQLRGKKRAWILFSHIYRWEGVDEQRVFLDYLDTMGIRLDSSLAPGASVYLYDLESQNH
jgi:uncharacterized membrane protein